MDEFGDLFELEETVDRADDAVQALQSVQASARRKKHRAFILRTIAATLETVANDELLRTREACEDITEPVALGTGERTLKD